MRTNVKGVDEAISTELGNVSLSRVILFVADVRGLVAFYERAFGLRVIAPIDDEWAVLQAGLCEIALHRVGETYRDGATGSARNDTNVKLVMTVQGNLEALRRKLIAMCVEVSEIRSYAVAGPHFDGIDPEGNVFQIAAA